MTTKSSKSHWLQLLAERKTSNSGIHEMNNQTIQPNNDYQTETTLHIEGMNMSTRGGREQQQERGAMLHCQRINIPCECLLQQPASKNSKIYIHIELT